MPNNQFDVTKVKIIPERTGPSLLTREYPKLSGFLQGLMGRAPDEVGGGSVLDEDAQSSRKLQALGAKYGFPIGTLAGMLPFGGGVAKAPSVVAGSRTAQKGIVKLPGGNWLSGSPEDAVKGLKRGKYGFSEPYTNEGLAELEALIKADPGREGSKLASLGASELQDMREKMAVNNWIDSQLVKKYIKNEMATERDPLRLMADAWPEKKAAKLAEVQSRIDALAERTRQLARERGQPEHTLTEMRQLMIPLEKEKALIEATEGLHYTPNRQQYGPGARTRGLRIEAGFPEEGLAQTPVARDWESLSDRSIYMTPAGDLLGPQTYEEFAKKLPGTYEGANPWLAKVPPETKVAHINKGLKPAEDLGFGHLIDELRNSLNPESGLPKELLMRYQDLPKVTVPQATERVAQINAWRAAQKHEADLLAANNAATVLHKDYPEAGMKWVEMKVPPKTGKNVELKEKLSEQLGLQEDGIREALAEMAYDEGFDPGTEAFEAFIRNNHPSRDVVTRSVDESEKLLADALKYEGDQMAHCVGGYCPDVLEGRSRIFSLRNTKTGKPHATIEVKPRIPVDYLDELNSAGLSKLTKSLGVDNLWAVPDEVLSAGLDAIDPAWRTPTIKQIKGFRNQKPDDAYLPYVQDFVKSGKWSDVGDLHNTGLIRHPETGEWVTGASRRQEVLDEIAREQRGFADGGAVNVGYNPDAINTRAAQLMEELGL